VTTTSTKQTQAEGRERRKANRYSLIVPGIVQTSRPQQSLTARTKDVSSRGAYIFVEPNHALFLGTELDLTLILPKEIAVGAEVLVRAHGRAVRVDKSAPGRTGNMGLALVFETCDFTRSVSPPC
jgi:hypothetical protein